MTWSFLLAPASAPLWAIGVWGGALLLGLLRGNVRLFAVLVIVEVGLFGWFRQALESTASPTPALEENEHQVRYVSISLARSVDDLNLVSAGPADAQPPPPDELSLPSFDRNLAPVPLPVESVPFFPLALGEGTLPSETALPGLEPGLSPVPLSSSATLAAGGADGVSLLPGALALPSLGDALSLPLAKSADSEFFPAVSGGRIVFVIDRSGSMKTNRRLERVKAEVEQIISEAPAGLEFAIVFFNDKTEWVGGGSQPSLLRQSAEAVRFAREAMSQIMPDGGTEPLPALSAALQLFPDEVFFLTDGDFRFAANDARALQERNVKKARIHGTLLFDKALSSGNHVAAIAQQHRGIFTSKREE